MRRIVFFGSVLLGVSLCAQVYPGQYPPGQYPPGQYPPGQYPGGGSSIPNPFPHKKAKDDAANKPTVNSGLFFDIEDNGFALQLRDKRILVFQVQKDTKFTSAGKDIALSDLGRGDELEVQSKTDQNNDLFAVAVKLIQKSPRAQGSSAAQGAVTGPAAGSGAPPEPPPTILQREDASSSKDEEQPRLKRGKPKAGAHDDDLEKEVEHDAAASPAARPTRAAPVSAPAASTASLNEAELPPNAPKPTPEPEEPVAQA
ncbi:MAG: hypothetical protein ACRD5L_12175, partial [Bryobacteraceae bacterium]